MGAMTAADASSALSSLAEWGVAARPIASEIRSGDAHLLVPAANGFLAAAMDGLGHGPEAAMAADMAVATLRDHIDEPIAILVQRCHESMRKTRGAVLSIASFSASDHVMSWVGVGNVEGVLHRADPATEPRREALLLRGGVVGYQIPSLRVSTLPIASGDVLILATDGISSGFAGVLPRGRHPQEIADEILSRWGKDSDDALVLVVRYLGGQS
jgi:negative regulator of sigma-B (phosphoserine phosphatase)